MLNCKVKKQKERKHPMNVHLKIVKENNIFDRLEIIFLYFQKRKFRGHLYTEIYPIMKIVM